MMRKNTEKLHGLQDEQHIWFIIETWFQTLYYKTYTKTSSKEVIIAQGKNSTILIR